MSTIPKRKWSSSEIIFLEGCYEKCEKAFLTEKLKRSWRSIQKKARDLGIERRVSKSPSKINRLLDGSNESFYWIGFLMADGNYTEKTGRFQLAVVDYDRDHIKKYADYVGANLRLRSCAGFPTTLSRDQYWVSASDRFDGKKIGEMFNFTNRKTYYPCNLCPDWVSDDQFFSMFVGFFDGDGCIHRRKPPRNEVSGHITIHPSWSEELINSSIRVKSILNINGGALPRLKGGGFVSWHLNKSLLTNIHLKILDMRLPVLRRKWDIL